MGSRKEKNCESDQMPLWFGTSAFGMSPYSATLTGSTNSF